MQEEQEAKAKPDPLKGVDEHGANQVVGDEGERWLVRCEGNVPGEYDDVDVQETHRRRYSQLSYAREPCKD